MCSTFNGSLSESGLQLKTFNLKLTRLARRRTIPLSRTEPLLRGEVVRGASVADRLCEKSDATTGAARAACVD